MKKYGPWLLLAAVVLGACWAFREGAGFFSHGVGWILSSYAVGFCLWETRLRHWLAKKPQ